MNSSSKVQQVTSHIAETADGPMVMGPADRILRKLRLGMSPRREFEIASAAIAVDPTCPQAHRIAGDAVADRQIKLAYYSDAVRFGNALWQPYVAAGNPVNWWADAGPRDFLLSIFKKARVLFELGYQEKSRLHFELLNALDPVDHLGAGDYFGDLSTNAATAKYMEPDGAQVIEEEQPRFLMQ